MIASRRSFLIGGATFLAAPAIIRVASLMPVSVLEPALMLGDPLAQAGYAGTVWWRAVMVESAGWAQIAMRDGKPLCTLINVGDVIANHAYRDLASQQA